MDDEELLRAPSPHPPAPHVAASMRSSVSPTTMRQRQLGVPRLGDFSRIQAEALAAVGLESRASSPSLATSPGPARENVSSAPRDTSHSDPVGPEEAVRLGNFLRIFARLGISDPRPPSREVSSEASITSKRTLVANDESEPDHAGHGRLATPSRHISSKKRRPQHESSTWDPNFTSVPMPVIDDSSSDIESLSDSNFDNDIHTAPPATPSSSVEQGLSPITRLAQKKAKAAKTKRAKRDGAPVTSTAPSQPLTAILAYSESKHGPVLAVLGRSRTTVQKHESLSTRLIPARATDQFLSAKHPDVASNGIHVFLDMSNINISFQETLRRNNSLPGHARFRPQPNLNLPFLTELLIRGRDTKVLNVGCSVHPEHQPPHYVGELHYLGYRVDLRDRKRVQEEAKPNNHNRHHSSHQNYSSSEEAPGRVRYVEDLVDETLQTRIGESVMKHFRQQGTLVIATGDAQPAKYSDGFYTYADRALQMGWNVEVVSWRCSLSSSWRNPAWTEQWGARFRVIELDEFWEDLLA